MKKNYLMIGAIGLFIFLIGIVSSANTYCCEKTTDGYGGFSCVNVDDKSKCSTSFDSVLNRQYQAALGTSCESTSFCKIGTCVDPFAGTCEESTKSACKGDWKDTTADEITQCQKGCCLVGEESKFVTQTACKKLGSTTGMEATFKSEIKSETQCIQMANPNEEGACVIKTGYERDCRILTREGCANISVSSGTTTETGGFFSSLFGTDKKTQLTEENAVEFYAGYLCSANSLNTSCGPSRKTTCVDGEDDVYFVDTCGNLANVYDSSKLNDNTYWTKMMEPVCGDSAGNKGSSSCGNCDYNSGSTCKAYQRTQDEVAPVAGENLCRDLRCTYTDPATKVKKTYEHGESWCVSSSLTADKYSPGSRDYRLVCMNNEILVEPCDDFRNEICIEEPVSNAGVQYSYAGCRMNLWRDCVAQTTKDSCEQSDVRDCKWIAGERIGTRTEADSELGTCVPLYSPGFDWWVEGTQAEEICSVASQMKTSDFTSRLGEELVQVVGGRVDYEAENNEKYCYNFDFLTTNDVRKEYAGCDNGITSNSKKEIENGIAYGINNKGWSTLLTIASALGDCGAKLNSAGSAGYENYSSVKVNYLISGPKKNETKTMKVVIKNLTK